MGNDIHQTPPECSAERRANDHRIAAIEKSVGEQDRLQEKMAGNIIDLDKRVMATELNHKVLDGKIEKAVTKDEFTPIRMIVYGLAASALTGLLSAILAKVLMK